MSVTLASIHSKQDWKGTVYRTSIGKSNFMALFPDLEWAHPTWEMVMGYKQGRITADQYTKQYKKLLIERWDEQVLPWLQSLDPNVDITLLCHCLRNPKFCHRQLIGRMIRKHRPDIEVIER